MSVAYLRTIEWLEVFILLKMIKKAFGITLVLTILGLYFSPQATYVRSLPDSLTVRSENAALQAMNVPTPFVTDMDQSVLVSQSDDERLADVLASANVTVATIRLFGVVPVKEVAVRIQKDEYLVPGGSCIGVALHTQGVLVVGVSEVADENGTMVSPAAIAGIQAGDIIECVNGIKVQDAEHLSALCNANISKLELTINRNGVILNTTIYPKQNSTNGQYQIGIWVRDSTAGIGTLSFYDPDLQAYAALGHAITDLDTRSNLSVRTGEIYKTSIIDVVQGLQGEPGELRGTFSTESEALGNITVNCEYGIYGKLYKDYHNALYATPILMARKEEVVTGPAHILTTVNAQGIKAYTCQIIKVNPQSYPAPKGMVIQVTDQELLETTGGIVQGMSGSPVIQNGKLVGVVTHVFINDPTKGYCMYAQWMHEQIKTNLPAA